MQVQYYGIDAIQFYTSHYYVDLEILAQARGFAPKRYEQTLGQKKMAVLPPDEDIVTMAADAGRRLLDNQNSDVLANIDWLMFATESSIDQSKAAGIFVHQLLNLPKTCRVVELKQACYAATAGLQLALNHIRLNPSKKVLLIASDIAKYGIGSNAESSQGGGAVAMLLSANPRILAIEPEYGIHTEDVMDFWRPNYRQEALVDGRQSCEMYLKLAPKTWQEYAQTSGRSYEDHAKFCYHVSVPRLVERAHEAVRKVNGLPRLTEEALHAEMQAALFYGREMGNCYTAALYLSICSLLENTPEDLSNQRIGLYSYGSGCVAEFFSGKIMPGYHAYLNTSAHQAFLASREALSIPEYEAFYNFKYPQDGSSVEVPAAQKGKYRLAAVENHKRIYQELS
ncbi:MAG: hydroxymethylglutaryl-CoA synthase [Gammaproteobacteria bacterium]